MVSRFLLPSSLMGLTCTALLAIIVVTIPAQVRGLPLADSSLESSEAATLADAIGLSRARRSLSSYHSDAMGSKRAGARGFHEGIFDQGFGGFTPLKKKRRPEMTSRGMNGDAFTAQHPRIQKPLPQEDPGGFGDFYTMKRASNDPSQLFNRVMEYINQQEGAY